MKDRTRTAFNKLGGITGKKCAQCPATEKYRCCDAMFCNLNAAYLRAVKAPEFPMPGVGGIPYMSESGCTIPPAYRPYCTGYVCLPHFTADRDFRREYDRLIGRIGQDPAAPPMPRIMKSFQKDRSTFQCSPEALAMITKVEAK